MTQSQKNVIPLNEANSANQVNNQPIQGSPLMETNHLSERFSIIPQEQLALLKKMTDMRKKMVSITKTGENDKYKFATSADVLAVVREQMDAHGVFLIPNIIDQKLQSYAEDNGTKRRVTYFTELWVQYTWVDVEGGGALSSVIYAQGIDVNGEKSVGKAMTYAEKYLMLKTFQIPTDEDPDFINNLDGVKGKAKVTAQQIGEIQLQLRTLAKLQNSTYEEVAQFIPNVTNGASLTELTPTMYNMVSARLAKSISEEEAKFKNNAVGGNQEAQQQPQSQSQPQNQGNQVNEQTINIPSTQEQLELVAEQEQLEQITISNLKPVGAQRPSLELITDKGKLLVKDIDAVNYLKTLETPITIAGVIQEQVGFKFLVNISFSESDSSFGNSANVEATDTKTVEQPQIAENEQHVQTQPTEQAQVPQGEYCELAFHSMRVRKRPRTNEEFICINVGNSKTVYCENPSDIETIRAFSPLEVFACDIYMNENFNFVHNVRSLDKSK